MEFSEPDSALNKYEQKLLRQYSQILSESMSINTVQAVRIAKEFLEESKQESMKEGMFDLPEKLGDILLGHEKTEDEKAIELINNIRNDLPPKLSDGVTETDIRWWWNLHDVNRRMIMKIDANVKVSLFVRYLDESKHPSREAAAEDAAQLVRKQVPDFGDPNDTSRTQGDDRPLPFELKERINNYTMRRTNTDYAGLQRDIEKHSTFNALVRKEIRLGNL